MKTLILIAFMLYVSQSAFADCKYEGKEFPEKSTLKMISSVKECRQGRWEKIKISKSEEACLFDESFYPENTIIKYAQEFRICKIKKNGYEWESAKLNDVPLSKKNN